MMPDQLERFFDENCSIVHVLIATARGSTPREVGAEMFVTKAATLGTIGGGRLEYIAIEEARKLLAAEGRSTELDIPLGPEIGQCCGGRVSISLVRMTDTDRIAGKHRATAGAHAQPHVYIMGSGHVGRALADCLQHMPFHTTIVDQREAELAHCHASVEKRLSALPESEIKSAPAYSAFIVLTHDHALDFLLTSAALARRDAAYVGLIGSATKRARFESWHREQGGAGDLGLLTCPIGNSERLAYSSRQVFTPSAARNLTHGDPYKTQAALEVRDKRPEIIAALVVAEVVGALTCHSRRSHLREAQCLGVG